MIISRLFRSLSCNYVNSVGISWHFDRPRLRRRPPSPFRYIGVAVSTACSPLTGFFLVFVIPAIFSSIATDHGYGKHRLDAAMMSSGRLTWRFYLPRLLRSFFLSASRRLEIIFLRVE